MNKLVGMAMLGIAAVATPAGADVKVGVDAWTRGEYRQAVEQWRQPAIAGDADAQFNLGQAYKLGRGVPVDPTLAESWFRKAALQGHLQAQDNYGLALFQAGKKADAVPWLEKSVARGEPRAQLVLGTMLFNGDGAPRDMPRAYALMTRASAAGLHSASRTLAEMDAYITPADRERGTALAQQYAARASAMPNAETTQGTRATDAEPIRVATAEPTPKTAATPVKLDKSATSIKLTPKAVAAKPVARNSRWRVQLGAFSSQANAQTQWGRVRARLSGAQPTYTRAGSVVRLQAGPYAGRAEAQRACAKSGRTCVVVAP